MNYCNERRRTILIRLTESSVCNLRGGKLTAKHILNTIHTELKHIHIHILLPNQQLQIEHYSNSNLKSQCKNFQHGETSKELKRSKMHTRTNIRIRYAKMRIEKHPETIRHNENHLQKSSGRDLTQHQRQQQRSGDELPSATANRVQHHWLLPVKP